MTPSLENLSLKSTRAPPHISLLQSVSLAILLWGPVPVLCSAGVGRSGAFILLDMALGQAAGEKRMDIPNILTRLRSQRMKMVQTPVSSHPQLVCRVNQILVVMNEVVFCSRVQLIVACFALCEASGEGSVFPSPFRSNTSLCTRQCCRNSPVVRLTLRWPNWSTPSQSWRHTTLGWAAAYWRSNLFGCRNSRPVSRTTAPAGWPSRTHTRTGAETTSRVSQPQPSNLQCSM